MCPSDLEHIPGKGEHDTNIGSGPASLTSANTNGALPPGQMEAQDTPI